jgi:predicted transcriptional regulator
VKTAVSIPDALFSEADALARRRRMSRSALYAEALQHLLDAQGDDDVTTRLDELYDGREHGVDPAITTVNTALFEDQW